MTRVIQLDHADYLQRFGIAKNEIDVFPVDSVRSRSSRAIRKTLAWPNDIGQTHLGQNLVFVSEDLLKNSKERSFSGAKEMLSPLVLRTTDPSQPVNQNREHRERTER